jgi:quercetin dioxygenase-like cupin family protein
MSEVYNFIPNLSDAIPDIPSNSIVSRTLHDDEGMKVILFGFAAGQMLSEHTASQPAMMTFLNGDVQLKLGDDSLKAQPGTWVYLPAHLPHSVHATTTALIMLVLYELERK